MNFVSDAFKDLMVNFDRYDVTLVQKVEFWNFTETTLMASTEMDDAPLYVPLANLKGSVTAQSDSDTARSMALTIHDPERSFLPGRSSRIMDPRSRTVVVPYSGYSWNGMTEVWPLGRFFLDVSEMKRGSLVISGRDTGTIAESPVETLYRIEAGWTQSQAISELIEYVEGLFGRTPVMSIHPTTETIPATTVMIPADDEPVLRRMREISDAAGLALFKDAYGRWTLKEKRAPSSTSGYDVELRANGKTPLLESNPTPRISINEIRNGVIVKVNAPWLLTPVQGEAWDEDAGSPTWIGGPLRRRPVVIENNSVVSLDAANAMAAARLPEYLGSSEEIPFTAMPLPALEPGDLIYYENSEVAISGVTSLKQFEIPIGTTDPMTGTLKYRRTSW